MAFVNNLSKKDTLLSNNDTILNFEESHYYWPEYGLIFCKGFLKAILSWPVQIKPLAEYLLIRI